jgi:hypothetical protein
VPIAISAATVASSRDIAEAELDDVSAKIGRQIGETGDDRLTGNAVYFGKTRLATCQTFVFHCSFPSLAQISEKPDRRPDDYQKALYGFMRQDRKLRLPRQEWRMVESRSPCMESGWNGMICATSRR